MGRHCPTPFKPCIHEHAVYALYCCVRRIFGARLINFLQTWGEQRTPSASVLFVFTQKTNKFCFVANGMRPVCGWHCAGSQSHPHICIFGLRTIREQFANYSVCSCIRGCIKTKMKFTWTRSPSYFHSQVNCKPSNRCSTSWIPFVGLANIGLTGTPGVILQYSGNAFTPFSRMVGTMRL